MVIMRGPRRKSLAKKRRGNKISFLGINAQMSDIIVYPCLTKERDIKRTFLLPSVHSKMKAAHVPHNKLWSISTAWHTNCNLKVIPRSAHERVNQPNLDTLKDSREKAIKAW